MKRACLSKLVDFSMNIAESRVRAAVQNESNTSVKTQAKWMTLYETPVPKHLMNQFKK